MLEAILSGFIYIAPWQYCWVMNAMVGKQKWATVATVTTPQVTHSKHLCYTNLF